jgi:hypothetical protein
LAVPLCVLRFSLPSFTVATVRETEVVEGPLHDAVWPVNTKPGQPSPSETVSVAVKRPTFL